MLVALFLLLGTVTAGELNHIGGRDEILHHLRNHEIPLFVGISRESDPSRASWVRIGFRPSTVSGEPQSKPG